MKLTEAEKLLGGYATGTLTEAERKRLFTAALERQDLFDALLDEEALRELLCDPEAKAQLLAALAPAPPKVIPLWRHPGLLGAAASLMVASLAGLAYLRSPREVPPMTRQEATKAVPPGETRREPQAPKADPPTAPPAPSSSSPSNPPKLLPSEAPRAMAEVVISEVSPRATEDLAQAKKVTALKAKSEDKSSTANAEAGAPSRSPGGVAAGILGGTVARRDAPAVAAPAPVMAAEAKAQDRTEPLAKVMATPRWLLEPLTQDETRVTVWVPGATQPVLLQRGPNGVQVLNLQRQVQSQGGLVPWQVQARLGAADTLDLYLLNRPVTDPSRLPENGPVNGYRARIHPAK
jgi:hypothetical protein